MREEMRFVLRLWRDTPDARAWRASLRALEDGRLQRFASLADLQAHLLACAGGEPTDAAERATATPGPKPDPSPDPELDPAPERAPTRWRRSP